MAKKTPSSDFRTFILKEDRNSEIAKWLENQHNASEAVRSLIYTAIGNFGTKDYLAALSKSVVLPKSIQPGSVSKKDDSDNTEVKSSANVEKNTDVKDKTKLDKTVQKSNASAKPTTNKVEQPEDDDVDYDELLKNNELS